MSFSWAWFALYAVIYSAIVFTGELSKDGPLIFSKRNARSAQQVLLAHATFLAVLLALYRTAVLMDAQVPNWMSERAGRGGTWYEGIFLAGLLVLRYIERRWLFVEGENPIRAVVPEASREE